MNTKLDSSRLHNKPSANFLHDRIMFHVPQIILSSVRPYAPRKSRQALLTCFRSTTTRSTNLIGAFPFFSVVFLVASFIPTLDALIKEWRARQENLTRTFNPRRVLIETPIGLVVHLLLM